MGGMRIEARHGAAAFRIPGAIPRTPEQWQEASARTLEAMRAGHQVLYQAPLAGGQWHGVADFLVRVENRAGESRGSLGDYHYEVVDTKLAQEARGTAILQLCVYTELLSGLQGRRPEHLTIASPAGMPTPGESTEPREHRFRAADFLAYFRLIRERLERFAAAPWLEATYPEPVEQCEVCSWWARCDARRRQDDHLSLVAGMGRGQRKLLTEAHVTTLEALGKLQLPMANRPSKLRRDSLERLHHQARLQLEARSAPARYELLAVEAGRGLCRLPPPSPGDVFFDIEADRYAVEGTFHYLLGWVEADGTGKPVYHGQWCQGRGQEQRAFEDFIDMLVERRQRHPDLHVYHFAPFERRALGELAARYASREELVDELFRNDVLVDLLPVVKQGLRAGVESYSLKELERFYQYERRTDLRAAAQARRLFELHRDAGSAAALPEVVPTIEAYNREDCESTLLLQRWLEQRRQELLAAGREVPRPVAQAEEPTPELKAWARRVEAIRERLLQGLAPEPAQRTEGQHARQLLADLVDWHRRDAKPAWWEYFRVRALTEEELVDDSGAIGGLGPEVDRGRIQEPRARSNRYEYSFPAQEFGIKEGDEVECPVTGQSVGTVIDVDRGANVVTVRRSKALERPPRALVEKYTAPSAKVLQEALAELAESLAPDFGLAAQDPTGELAFSAGRALLLRSEPRLAPGVALQLAGEPAVDATKRIGPHLCGSVLAVQGPPGAGKTYAGGEMIVDLVLAGKKVGITATSHAVIEKLLAEVHEAAQRRRASRVEVRLFSIQKPQQAAEPLAHPCNVGAKKAIDVAKSLASGDAQVAAGTAWLWCDPQLRSAVDVLVVDEGGQFSLANALAVSVAARNLVLLGDPQQLAQPSQGSHPPGAGVSALEHLLAGNATLPAGRGLFMDCTWRLPPAIASFTSEYFYASRLQSHPDCGKQRLLLPEGSGGLAGAGLLFAPVDHHGNVNSSSEEAERIVQLVSDILMPGARWVSRKGKEAPVTLKDILIVAPYNAQVELITECLKECGQEGARVGTVDKFQGQEAPVVLYSLATSNPEDAPRGFDFLYSLNRLNVATSRAQAMVVLIASPRLLEAQCKTPRQMRLVNGLCGAVEKAGAAGKP